MNSKFQATLLVSDPWEFGTEHGVGPFEIEIIRFASDSSDSNVLVRLTHSLEFNGTHCEYFVAEPRHGDSTGLLRGESVSFNLTAIPQEYASSENPFDISWWRGGVGLIGQISPILDDHR